MLMPHHIQILFLNFLKNPVNNKVRKFKNSITFKKQISFCNVSFFYNEDENNKILKDVNLNIKFGSRIGITLVKKRVVRGKSTFADLVFRFTRSLPKEK